jgi:flagellar basal-body rod modification protein FlgD
MQVTSGTTTNNAALYASLSGPNSSTARTAKQTLGSQDFMQLLATQMENQDPMQPMEDTAFIAQMAQFSSLQQSSEMVAQMTQLRADQQQLAATGYLGRQVTLIDGSGKTVTGTVSAIDTSGPTPQLVVNGANYPVSTLTRVEPAAG